MKKQKTTPNAKSIPGLILAIALFTSTAATFAAPSTKLEGSDYLGLADIQQPSSLGGVSLRRLRPWQPPSTYGFVPNKPAIENVTSLAGATQINTAVDATKTAAISPGVFRSVALSMRSFPVATRWASIYRAIVECSDHDDCSRRGSSYSNMVEIARRKGLEEKLSFVNSTINRMIAYKTDNAVYHNVDYWAKPSEVLERRAGDCEDFAILKMTALLSADVPASDMSLVVLQDRKRGFFHAVLAIRTSEGAFILDNLSNIVLKDSELPDYQPLYSFSTDQAWIHGAKAGMPRVADIRGGMAAVSPGEGM
ncbi:transglutaminase [Mesorhizobium loti]|uniref:Transglutaminase n=1 Tax=Rhizobium loti TaxID=381 RepID=A0A101KT25_RHILI|nr:transglutaminase [Mesorhizobium loti]